MTVQENSVHIYLNFNNNNKKKKFKCYNLGHCNRLQRNYFAVRHSLHQETRACLLSSVPLIVKDVDVSAICEEQWCGRDRGVLAGDGLKHSHPEVWDAQSTTLLKSFAARAGLTDKEGSTHPHPWDTEASP